MMTEVGIPRGHAERGQVLAGARHLKEAIDALRDYAFDEDWGTTRVRREPVGVCALLAPWNWPMNQVACKVGPALAAGCTRVLKPSQLSPLSALVFAEAVDEAGYPAGVFNMVNGAGAALGDTFATHPLVDMISLTGSTAVGGVVGAAAAPSIKRVSLELGGKSANLVFEDVDVARAVSRGVHECMHNSGQSCNAPTRMLVAQQIYDEALEVAARVADELVVGDPRDPDTFMGPVAGRKQYETVPGYIRAGVDEGARLVAGGLERPDGLDKGFFVRPTVFADVTPEMGIFREEIFGPVLTVTPFRDEDHAVDLANASDYGLSGYVQSADLARARRAAGRMRTGMVHLNGAPTDASAPFGGYKQSGNGREWGVFGLEEYLEVKSIMGYTPPER
jgi:aldehyde dehydrogenase (NAD+)